MNLTVSIPKAEISDRTFENLQKIVANKAEIMKHAFGTDDLTVTESCEAYHFGWFDTQEDSDAVAYSQFIAMLIKYAENRSWIPKKPDTSTNEKYAFRCFLLRIGMIGDDYKTSRKVLLRNLTGNSARSK